MSYKQPRWVEANCHLVDTSMKIALFQRTFLSHKSHCLVLESNPEQETCPQQKSAESQKSPLKRHRHYRLLVFSVGTNCLFKAGATHLPSPDRSVVPHE